MGQFVTLDETFYNLPLFGMLLKQFVSNLELNRTGVLDTISLNLNVWSIDYFNELKK